MSWFVLKVILFVISLPLALPLTGYFGARIVPDANRHIGGAREARAGCYGIVIVGALYVAWWWVLFRIAR
jgi:hypothetical protein